ncbi:MAG: cobalamin B12-binding domain-containing protein [Anaerolinea sp.]|nr:cobalamin B12-binding domain-containing protein [Anaerolinea sp.]
MATPQTTYLRSHQQALAEKIVKQQYARHPEIWLAHGEQGRNYSVRDAGYHLVYLAEAIEADDPLLFNEYLAWVTVLFANLNFPNDTLSTTLDCARQVLSESLPAAEKEAALALLDAATAELDNAPTTLPSFLNGSEPLDELARQFLAALLQADRHTASRLILDAVKKEFSIKEIYLQVFQRTQREIGRLWQTNQIGVAEEHFCTAATQMIMSQLYPYIFTGERKDRRAVIACVGGELHEIGARMVADFLEMSGWDTYFLGANTPPRTILQTVEQRQADLLALSATMTFHVSEVTDIIRNLRADNNAATHVLVGGYPFNLSPDLWRKVGADGYAADAATAVAAADKLITNSQLIPR